MERDIIKFSIPMGDFGDGMIFKNIRVFGVYDDDKDELFVQYVSNSTDSAPSGYFSLTDLGFVFGMPCNASNEDWNKGSTLFYPDYFDLGTYLFKLRVSLSYDVDTDDYTGSVTMEKYILFYRKCILIYEPYYNDNGYQEIVVNRYLPFDIRLPIGDTCKLICKCESYKRI